MTENHAPKPNQRKPDVPQDPDVQSTRNQPKNTATRPYMPEQRKINETETATNTTKSYESQTHTRLAGKQPTKERDSRTIPQSDQLEINDQESQVGDSQDEEAGETGGEGLDEEEELTKMVKAMLASGFTAESLKKKIAPKTKKEKEMMRKQSLGEGRLGGSGRGKPI